MSFKLFSISKSLKKYILKFNFNFIASQSSASHVDAPSEANIVNDEWMENIVNDEWMENREREREREK